MNIKAMNFKPVVVRCVILSLSMLSLFANGADKPNSRQEIINELSYKAQNRNLSIDERSTALKALADYPSQNGLIAIARALKESDRNIRLAAIQGLAHYDLKTKWPLLKPQLQNDWQPIELQASYQLLSHHAQLNDAQRQQLAPHVNAWFDVEVTKNNANLALQKADVTLWTGELKQAETLYRALFDVNQHQIAATIGLTEVYRLTSENNKAMPYIEKALNQHPESGKLYYAQTMIYVRLQDKPAARKAITLATQYAPNNSYYWYLQGALLTKSAPDKAIDAYETAYLLSGAPEQLYALCQLYIDTGDTKTDECLKQLATEAPQEVVGQLINRRES